MATIRTRTLLLILTLGAVSAPAQVAPTGVISATELYVTMDAAALAPFTCDWLSFVFRDLDGNHETVDFLQGQAASGFQPMLVSNGFGAWGPRYNNGNYVFEPFWLSQALGNLGGIMHIQFFAVPFPPNPATFTQHPYEAHPAFTADHRLGLRFARQDGAAFTLSSIVYRGADVDFLLGTQLVAFPSFAGFQRVTPTLNTTNFVTLTFPQPPDAIDAIRCDDQAASGVVTFQTSTGTFALATTVTSIERHDGGIIVNPAIDALVGGALTITGTYTGADLSGLSDVHFAPATLTLTSTTGEVLSMTAGFAPGAPYWHLLGPLAALPVRHRPLSRSTPATVTHSGSGSATLASLAFLLPLDALRLHFRMPNSGPRLLALERRSAPPAGAPSNAFATDGTGNLQIGVIDMPPSVRLHHFIDVNPSGSLGAGPFFGIGFGADQIAQFTLPLGLHPFHVLASPEGVYSWGLPSGTVPPGIIADVVLIALPGTQPFAMPVVRVFF